VSLVVLGLSHRTCPMELLERAALDSDAVVRLLEQVSADETISEVVVLSTCNRIEVYAQVPKFHPAIAVLTQALRQHTGLAEQELVEHLSLHYDEHAVAHLFAVAAGLDSMVVGEAQILGQVRAALHVAQATGTVGRVLNEAFQQALRVGKRAHSETGIDRAGQSVVSVGLELGQDVVGGFADRRALVVGAGSMSALATSTLLGAGVRSVVVANRTLEHARRLAERVGARAASLSELDRLLAEADVVVTCTGAVGTVLTAEQLAAAQLRRGAAPMFVLDLALPRDVDPAAENLDGVTLVDLARLGHVLAGDERVEDIAAARDIVASEVEAFADWLRASAVAPTITALRSMADGVVAAELTRLYSRLPGLDQRVTREVEQTVHRIVGKLLHTPTVRVKALAAEPEGANYAQALRDLFDLDPQHVAVEALVRSPVDGAA
jgi:glutamyl-tRNA reductase